ncbi:MAG: S-methyl-5'-thioinosine phosphorylase [Anaerolineae bacterium]|jgi:5'-methylthioadenosine phosphorylase|nr:S-methyl-5'-thioinosine phosphorylase [Anaerolineae bacterium]
MSEAIERSKTIERVAIIGGTGVYELPGLVAEERTVETPYGPVDVRIADAEPYPVVYLNRHGLQREAPPHRINYRANITALRMLGVTRALATNAVGSINREVPPASLMIIDDYLDFTSGRAGTFFDGGPSGHAYLEMSTPCCPALRRKLLERAAWANIALRPGGTYVCTNGPRFETPAEIRMFERLGGDVVGMTGMPEATLARELGIHYAAVAYSINWAAGLEPQIEIVREGIPDLVFRLLALMLEALQTKALEPCPCAEPIIMVSPSQQGGGVYRP